MKRGSAVRRRTRSPSRLRRAGHPPRSGSAGFTTVELTVSMGLLVMLMLVTVNVYGSSLRSHDATRKRAEAVLDARTGLERMTREIRQALPISGQQTITITDAASKNRIEFQRYAPGSLAGTPPGQAAPRVWVRYDCSGARLACRRASWPVGGSPPADGGSVLDGLVDDLNVFDQPSAKLVSVSLRVRVPGQTRPVRLSDAVALRNEGTP